MLSADTAFPSPAVAFRGFGDGLGERVVTRTGNDAFESLHLAAALANAPRCASGLQAGVEAADGFVHPAFQPPPVIEWPASGENRPVIVSRYTPARRVIDLLADAQASGRPIATSATLFIVRDLLAAVQAWHAHADGVFHGAIGPERVLLTPDLQVIVAEHALGPMLAAVCDDPSAPVLPSSCGILVPGRKGYPAFSPMTDQLQVALVGLALFVGRRIACEEYPFNIGSLLDSVTQVDLVGRSAPLDPLLREWFARALLVSSNGPFPDLAAAAGDLETVMSEGGHVAAPVGLEVEAEALVPMLSSPTRPVGPTSRPEAPKPPPLRLAMPRPSPSALADESRDGVETRAERKAPAGHADDPQAQLSFSDDLGAGPPPIPSRGGPAKPLIVLPELEGVAPDPSAAGESLLHLATTLEGRTHGAQATATTDGVEAEAPRGWKARLRPSAWPLHVLIAGATLAIVLVAGIVAAGYYVVMGRRPAQLVFESLPPGVDVLQDGKPVGRTPLTLSLPRGGHYFELRGRYSSQTVSVLLHAGEQRRERVELPEAGAPGTLVVLTEPPGVPIRIDDEVRGEAPLTLDIAPGRHVVSASNEVATISREVLMPLGGKIDLALPVSGWIEIVSPVPVQTTVSGRPIPPGTTRFASATGRFRIECVNDAIGLRDVQDVVVEAGRTVEVAVAGTTALLDITADVADSAVWIDGKLAGRVPLSSVAVPLGPHEIRFVHPQRGEVRYQVDVGMGASRLRGEFGAVPQGRAAPARRR